MKISNQALTGFITIQFINMGTLIADYIAKINKLPAITDIAVRYPTIGVFILVFECLSPISLVLHFWYYDLDTN